MNAYLKQNCDKCRYLGEVAGGSELVYWCKTKNEHIPYPTITRVFCKSFKEVVNDVKNKQDISKKER